MIIRALDEQDIPKLKEIHGKYFHHEFALNEFLDSHLIQGFAAVTIDNEIVAAGGVRTILESVLLTNKDFDIFDRREALYNILQASVHMTKALDYQGLHAFIQDSKWLRHLKRVGFKETKGQSLVLPI